MWRLCNMCAYVPQHRRRVWHDPVHQSYCRSSTRRGTPNHLARVEKGEHLQGTYTRLRQAGYLPRLRFFWHCDLPHATKATSQYGNPTLLVWPERHCRSKEPRPGAPRAVVHRVRALICVPVEVPHHSPWLPAAWATRAPRVSHECSG